MDDHIFDAWVRALASGPSRRIVVARAATALTAIGLNGAVSVAAGETKQHCLKSGESCSFSHQCCKRLKCCASQCKKKKQC